jgi:6-phosphogluconolactonase
MSNTIISFFIGSYTEYPVPGFGGIGKGIYSVDLNTETGELSVQHTKISRNPSYLAISDGNKFLYAVSELDESTNPQVRSFEIQEDGSLSFLNERPIPGGYPCHIISEGNNVMVACYATGNLLHYTTTDKGEFEPKWTEFQHEGSSINQERQEGPHAHQVVLHPNGKDVYVCDMGIDVIKVYLLKNNTLLPNPKKDGNIKAGSGPRHVVFNKKGDWAYVINELTGTVTVMEHTSDNFKAVNEYNTLPASYKDTPSSSAIRLHPNEKYLYAANRTLEAITIFRVDGPSLEILDYQYTKGEVLREFNISPDGNWLIACHQNSHDTVVYRIEDDGTLEEKYRTTEILSPVCISFQK